MKTYIEVPFVHSERVKAMGARWDMSRRQWYVPDGVDLTPFLRWLPTVKVTAEIAKVLRSRVDHPRMTR